MMLFGVLFTSLWRPDDAPPDDPSSDGSDDDKDDTGRHKAPTAEEIYEQYKAGKLHTQNDLEHEAGKRLEREQRKAKEAQEETERKAKEDALKEQGKYQEMYENQATDLTEKNNRIQELEAKETEAGEWKTKYEDLETRYSKLIEDRLAVVPEPFQPLLETMSVTQRADWLDTNAEKLQGYVNGKAKGPGFTGKGGPAKENPEREEAAKAEHRRAAHAAM